MGKVWYARLEQGFEVSGEIGVCPPTLLCNRLWKWLVSSSPIDGAALGQLSGKQFSPFMEMVCYRLWKW
jgi:hypothetical protein